jgi:hypothetical protein
VVGLTRTIVVPIVELTERKFKAFMGLVKLYSRSHHSTSSLIICYPPPPIPRVYGYVCLNTILLQLISSVSYAESP